MIGGLITASGNGWQQFINGTNIGGPVLPVSTMQKGGKTRLKKKSKKRKSRKRKSRKQKYNTK